MKILTIFTCFNRRDKTEKCIETLVNGNPSCEFNFIAVDDNSSDGTFDMLCNMKEQFRIYPIKGNGALFYSGGMRMGMKYALDELEENYDYLLMTNDDVEFFEGCVEKLIEQSSQRKGAVIVGAMCSAMNTLTYGAIKYDYGIKYHKMQIKDHGEPADTFNANCVLIPYQAFKQTGPIDEHYIHSLGDFDYGFELKRHGYQIFSSSDYVGICENNSRNNTWANPDLKRMKRIKLKETPKGAPAKQWFYFLKKNFGLLAAVKGSVTPYVRILMGK